MKYIFCVLATTLCYSANAVSVRGSKIEYKIPQVDISPLLALDIGGDNISNAIRVQTEKAVAKQFAQACRDVGFVTIVGHGVGHDMLEMIEKRSQQFFSLHSNVKMDLAPRKWNPQSSNQYRGYFPASVNGKEGFDLSAPFQVTPIGYVRHLPLEEQPVFPPENENSQENAVERGDMVAKGWRNDISRYYQTMNAIGKRLLKLVATEFNISWTELEKQLFHSGAPNLSTMRLNYYPATTKHDANRMNLVDNEGGASVALSCESHCDNALLTILYQGNVGGLQVQVKHADNNHEEEWIDVPVTPGALVVNTGVALQQLVNGLWNATNHRVLVTGKERISVPFFLEPSYGADLTPLNEAVKLVGVNRFKNKPTTYGDYITIQNRRLKEYRREDLEKEKERLDVTLD